MKMLKAVTGIAAVAAALTFAPFASAAEGLRIHEREVRPDQTVLLSYVDSSGCSGLAKSEGFKNGVSTEFKRDENGVMHATAVAADKPGTYHVYLKCGGVISETFTIVGVTARDTFFLPFTEVEAGGDVSVAKTKQSDCGQIATSPGFTAPIELKYETPNTFTGNGKAVDKPGTYQVEMICGGEAVHQELVVKAKAPAAKPKQPIVKPKGAPQTGGGATA